MVELQPSKLIVWVRFPSSAPKKQGAQRVPFLFGQADWESKASVKKTVRRTVFSESADDTMSLLTPRKAAQVASLKLTHIIRSKKTRHPREALRKEVASLSAFVKQSDSLIVTAQQPPLSKLKKS